MWKIFLPVLFDVEDISPNVFRKRAKDQRRTLDKRRKRSTGRVSSFIVYSLFNSRYFSHLYRFLTIF